MLKIFLCIFAIWFIGITLVCIFFKGAGPR